MAQKTRATRTANGLVVIYHRVRAREDHDSTVRALWKILHYAQTKFPNQDRQLLLDIEGHRNPAGVFDTDMFDVQTQFVVGVLMNFLKEARTPVGVFQNTHEQNNDVPEQLDVLAGGPAPKGHPLNP